MTEPPYSIEEALDSCLARMHAGESLAACLKDVPAYADELAPLLATYVELRDWSPPQQSVRVRTAARTRARVALRRLQGGRAFRWGWGRWALRAGAVALLLVALLSSGVAFAGGSRPGDPLYPLKQAKEAFQHALTRDSAERAGLQLAFTQHRIDEILSLARAKKLIERGLLDQLRGHYRMAAAAITAAAPGQRPGLQARYHDTITVQQRALDQAMSLELPEALHLSLADAAAILVAADGELVLIQPTATPSAAPEAPSARAEPSAVRQPDPPTATATERPQPSPTATLTRTATETAQPGETATATASAAPRPTAAPAPTAAPSVTPTADLAPIVEPPPATPTASEGPYGSYRTPTSDASATPTPTADDDGQAPADPGTPPSATPQPPTATRAPEAAPTSTPGDTKTPRPTDDHGGRETRTPAPAPSATPRPEDSPEPTRSPEPEAPTRSPEPKAPTHSPEPTEIHPPKDTPSTPHPMRTP